MKKIIRIFSITFSLISLSIISPYAFSGGIELNEEKLGIVKVFGSPIAIRYRTWGKSCLITISGIKSEQSILLGKTGVIKIDGDDDIIIECRENKIIVSRG